MAKRRTLGVLGLLAATFPYTHVIAEPCAASGMNTYQQAECWMKEADIAESNMLSSYASAEAALKTAASLSVTPDLLPALVETQQRWDEWLKVQCNFEGGATMGSAGGVVAAMCKIRLDTDRRAFLDSLADQTKTLSKKQINRSTPTH